MLLQEITACFANNLKGKHFALWGLTFKPCIDDMRNAPSRMIMERLWAQATTISVHNLVTMRETQLLYGNKVNSRYAETPMDTLQDAGAFIIVTKWKADQSPDFEGVAIKSKSSIIFDSQNQLEPKDIKALDIKYYGIERGKKPDATEDVADPNFEAINGT